MDAARAECPSEDIARQLFKRLPGKPLRGRWGPTAAIEDVMFSARNFVGPVLTGVRTPLLAAKRRCRRRLGGRFQGGPKELQTHRAGLRQLQPLDRDSGHFVAPQTAARNLPLLGAEAEER
eukprot:7440357-Pyramimonas_sp.AAC.1